MIDHSGHPHPSTPAARALCRGNGGTGSIAKKSKAEPKAKAPAKKKKPASVVPKKPAGPKPPPKAKIPGLSEPKVPVAKKVNTQPPVKKATPPPVKKKPPMSAAKHSSVMSKTADEDTQAEMLQAAPIGIDGLDDRGFEEGEKEAADFYIGAGYTFVNSALRGQSQATDKAKDTIEKLDAVMERSKLTEDVGVYRGIENGRLLFGDSFDGDLTGVEWREKAYSSTTVNEDVADDFIGADSEDNDDLDPSEMGPMKMRIVLPAGTPAMQASDVDDEAELIVGRNSNFRVVKDNGEDDSGVRVIDVELIL